MMKGIKATWTEPIKITDLLPGDLIYIKKLEAGYGYIYECVFVKYQKGIIHAKILNCDRWNYPGGFRKSMYRTDITVRPKNAFLWGKSNAEKNDTCHWFKNKGMAE